MAKGNGPGGSSGRGSYRSERTRRQAQAAARGQGINLRPNTLIGMNAQTNTSGSILSRADRARQSRGYRNRAARAAEQAARSRRPRPRRRR